MKFARVCVYIGLLMHFAGIATSLRLSTVPNSDTSTNLPDVTTMAFDGEDWFLKPVRKEVSFARSQESSSWKPTENCNIRPENSHPASFHSQLHEDLDLYNAFFCGKKNGVFAEMGALDGVTYSNTNFFENSQGWSGVLIEASPRSAAKLLRNRGGHGKNSIFAEGVCKEGQSSMNFFTDANPAVHGNPDTMSDQYKQKILKTGNKQLSTTSVPCRSLSAILGEFVKRSQADHIDFFSLDVEGGELAVLQTFKFDVKVKVWLIEMDGNNKEKDEGVRKLLTEHGYVKSKTKVPFHSYNEVWVLPEMDAVSQ